MNSLKPNPQRSNREKARIVQEVEWLVVGEGHSVLDACKKVGIHHSQYYRWKKLAEAEADGDGSAWKPRSKRPKRLARKTSDSIRERVICLARSGSHRSANSIAKTVSKEIGRSLHPATVISILENAGLYGTIEVRGESGQLLRKKRGLKIQTNA